MEIVKLMDEKSIVRKIVSYVINSSSGEIILDDDLNRLENPIPFNVMYEDTNMSISVTSSIPIVYILGDANPNIEDEVHKILKDLKVDTFIYDNNLLKISKVYKTPGNVKIVRNIQYNTSNICSLIIDTNNILVPDAKNMDITSYSNYKYVIQAPIIFSSIFNILPSLFALYDLTMPSMYKYITFPEIREEWSNINPIHSPGIPFINLLFTSSGSRCEGDRCSKCGIRLFGSINVLEYESNHVCVCKLCLTSVYVVDIITFYSAINVLAVEHPTTIEEVLEDFDITDDHKQILIEVYKNGVFRDNQIHTKNYTGYRDIVNTIACNQKISGKIYEYTLNI